MKLKLKEDPKEWRSTALMTMMAFAVLSSVLRWRRVMPVKVWIVVLSLLAIFAMVAALRPKYFRGYYRYSAKLGFILSQGLGYVVLVLLFFLVITPLGLVMQMLGKDPLRLRRPVSPASYWSEVRQGSSLDRLY